MDGSGNGNQHFPGSNLCVGGAMRSSGVLCSYFFDGTVDAQKYLDMLHDFVTPQVDTDNGPTSLCRNFLDDTFEMWIRSGTIE